MSETISLASALTAKTHLSDIKTDIKKTSDINQGSHFETVYEKASNYAQDDNVSDYVNKSSTASQEKTSQQDAPTKQVTDKNQTHDTKSAEENIQDPSQEATEASQNNPKLIEELTDILENPDLSTADKIEKLAHHPELSDLSFEEQVNIIAQIFQDLPDIQRDFEAFLSEFEDAEVKLTAIPENLQNEEGGELEAIPLEAKDTNVQELEDYKQEEVTQEEPQDNIYAVLVAAQSSVENNKLSNAENTTDKVKVTSGTTENLLNIETALSSDQNMTESDLSGPAYQETELEEADIIQNEQPVLQENDPKSLIKNSISEIENNQAPETVTLIKEAELPANSLNQINTQQQTLAKTEIKLATIPLKDNVTLTVTRSADAPSKIGINLEPAGMGEAELVIESRDNSVAAIIRSDKPEILDMIRKEAASLEKYLTEAGIDLAGGQLQFERQESNGKSGSQDEIQNFALNDADSQQTPINTQNNIYQTLGNLQISDGVDVRL
ncbi:MAG: flagellar hook-length control protein FliK [Pseudomonadota bacterium]